MVKYIKLSISNLIRQVTELFECAVNKSGRRLLNAQYQKTMFENYGVKISYKPQKPMTEAFNV